jgi:DNA-binding NarL/FixJ family response regulator
MIRILIADDHNIVRQGLTLILERSGEMEVVQSCTNGTDAMKWLANNSCDVALIDVAMPGMGGIDLLGHIRKYHQRLPVLILSAYPEDQYAVRLIKAGASGYLNKECAPEEVVAAVHAVLEGRKHISLTVAELLANELSVPEGRLPHETLSNREYQILLLFAAANSVGKIAESLKLSVKTISTYRARILEKMNMNNNAELMSYAIKRKLIR